MKRRFAGGRGSLRTRLMLWNMAALAVILIAFGGVIQYSVRTRLLDAIDHDLRDKTPPEFGPGRPPHNREDGPAPPDNGSGRPESGPDKGHGQPPPDGNAPDDPLRAARLNWQRPRMLGLDGKTTHRFGRQESAWDTDAFQKSAQGQTVLEDILLDGEPYRLYSQPMRNHGQIDAVSQGIYPLTEAYRTIDGMNRVLLTLIPVALLLAGLGGAAITDRALRPMRHFAQTAEQIGADDLSRRLPVAGEDEFARLASTFNAMLGRLETTFAQRAALVAQLEDLIEQQRRFTGDASHELRTPLTVIKANTSLLLPTEPTPSEWREAMEDIDRAASSMTRLVHDLLLLTRSDGGQLGRNAVALPVAELLSRAAQNVGKAGGAAIRVEANDPSIALCGNPDEISRLITNLLENAVRHTPPTGSVRLTAQSSGASVQIQVIDTGAGIAPEHLPHLCERFYRVDAARSRPDGGTGLGLAIGKSIVEAHGGTLHFASTLGKGTTVTVTLPRAAQETEDREQRTGNR